MPEHNFFSGKQPEGHPTEVNPVVDPQTAHPDIPRGADDGFYFDRYVRQVYLRKDAIGWFTYDSSQSNDADRITGGTAPFTVEKPEAGTVLLKGVANKYLIQANSYGTTFHTLEISVFENDDIQIKLKSGGVILDGEIHISYIKVQ